MTVAFLSTTRADVHSRVWDNLLEDLTARLNELRVENDSFSDLETTAKRRGRIAELKEWLALAEQARSSDDSRHLLSSFPVASRPSR